MNWLWIWWIGCIVVFLVAHWWMFRDHDKKVAEIYARHDKAMEEIFAKYRK